MAVGPFTLQYAWSNLVIIELVTLASNFWAAVQLPRINLWISLGSKIRSRCMPVVSAGLPSKSELVQHTERPKAQSGEPSDSAWRHVPNEKAKLRPPTS